MKKNSRNNHRPASAREQRQTLHKNLGFVAAEQYKLLRTNLQFTLPDEEECRVVSITSSVRGEGKSTTAINLAYSLSESGKKVLLIDADMRLPSVAKKLDMQQTPGLSNILTDRTKAEIPLYKSPHSENWFILPSGDVPPNPSELLGSKRMNNLLDTLKERFDFIIIDLPPVNIVSDAMVLAPVVHGLIVVIRAGYTERKELNNCTRQINLSDTKLLGFVVNDAINGETTYGKYKYKKYKYYKNYYKNNTVD